MFSEIIIVQTSEPGFLMAKRAIEELGLADRSALLVHWNPELILSLLYPTKHQLFITGTVCGIPGPVTELRKTYPNLTCLSFAVFNALSSPPFHGHIKKTAPGGPVKALRDAILKFRQVSV